MKYSFLLSILVLFSCTSNKDLSSQLVNEEWLIDTTFNKYVASLNIPFAVDDSIINWDYLKFETDTLWSDEVNMDLAFPIWEKRHYSIADKEKYYVGKLVTTGSTYVLLNPEITYGSEYSGEWDYLQVFLDTVDYLLPPYMSYNVYLKGKLELMNSTKFGFNYHLNDATLLWIEEIKKSD